MYHQHTDYMNNGAVLLQPVALQPNAYHARHNL